MLAVLVLALLMGPVTGSLFVKSEPTGWEAVDHEGFQWMPAGYSFDVPSQAEAAWLADDTPWWERTALDQNRNAIHDSLESTSAPPASASPTALRSTTPISQPWRA